MKAVFFLTFFVLGVKVFYILKEPQVTLLANQRSSLVHACQRIYFLSGYCIMREAQWRIGGVDAFRLEGRGFESRSSRHVGILGKSFTTVACRPSACILRHSINCCGQECF